MDGDLHSCHLIFALNPEYLVFNSIEAATFFLFSITQLLIKLMTSHTRDVLENTIRRGHIFDILQRLHFVIFLEFICQYENKMSYVYYGGISRKTKWTNICDNDDRECLF